MNYQDISIHKNLIQSLEKELLNNVHFYMLPLRTVNIRFDDVLTLSDYDLKNYTQFLITQNNLLTTFAKDYFIIFDFKKFTEAKCVSSFETY